MTPREKAAAVLQAHAGDALDALVSVMRQRDEAHANGILRAADYVWPSAARPPNMTDTEHVRNALARELRDMARRTTLTGEAT